MIHTDRVCLENSLNEWRKVKELELARYNHFIAAGEQWNIDRSFKVIRHVRIIIKKLEAKLEVAQ